jgi:hypothetical protein
LCFGGNFEGNGKNQFVVGQCKILNECLGAQLKMEDACNLCNVIEFFCQRKPTKTKKKGLWFFQALNGIGIIV